MSEALYDAIRAELDVASEGRAFTADGYESALVGIAEGWIGDTQRSVALYDYAACIDILMAEGLDRDEAEEHMTINTCGSYVGDGTPFFAVFYKAPQVAEPGSF